MKLKRIRFPRFVEVVPKATQSQAFGSDDYDLDLDPAARTVTIVHRASGALLVVEVTGAEWVPNESYESAYAAGQAGQALPFNAAQADNGVPMNEPHPARGRSRRAGKGKPKPVV